MKRVASVIPLILFGVALNILVVRAQPAPAPQYLPAIRVEGQADTTVCDAKAPLLDEDTGSLSAIRDADGRYIIAAQLRSHGSRVYVFQHVGAGLADLAAPFGPPSLSPPGPKQGSVALVPSAAPGGKSRLYFTQRALGDTDGPYSIWCMEV